VEHYRIIASAAGIPFFVYNLPQSTGVEITPDYLKKIMDHVPQLTGLKHSAPEFTNNINFTKMGLRCFTGNARLMLAALTLGAAGCVDGAPCATPEIYVKIWNSYQKGDMEQAKTAQTQAVEIFEVLLKAGNYPANVKALASERIGLELGPTRLPIPSLAETERAWVHKEAKRLGLLSNLSS
jgi:dihydrodipicolinate synthase/N-acetylneuraminate lyase